MRILIVEDGISITRALAIALKRDGFYYETVDSGETAIEHAHGYVFDAILLGLDLPDLHGHQVVRRLRQLGIDTPVLIVSGANVTEAKLEGFEAGADDYISEHFQLEELVARLHALIRRSHGHSDSIVRAGALTIDLIARTVSVDNWRVRLTRKEYAIVELFALRRGKLLTRMILFNHLYGSSDGPEEKIVDVYICSLRKKLEQAGLGTSACLETVWGSGYTLRDPSPASAAA